MRIGVIYGRVSTSDQKPEKQVDSLKTFSSHYRIKVIDVYVDVASGSKDTRPELNRLMFDMRKGLFNCVLITKLDRLGRSLGHLITICEEFNNKGIDLIVQSQNIDTKTASGKLLFHVLGAVAEFERELISERTKEGLRKAKNVGKRGKDKKKRRTAGYNLRYQKKGGLKNA